MDYDTIGEDFFSADLFVDKEYVSQEMRFGGTTVDILSLNTASTDFDLTGQVLWGGCKILSIYIEKNSHLFDQKTILEVGAGAGVCGIVAAKCSNPKSVVITDHNEHVLELLDKNIDHNALEDKVVCRDLCWGHEIEEFKERESTFDIILGADVIYWASALIPLFETVDALLAPKDAIFFLAYRERSKANTRDLYKTVDEYNFSIESLSLEEEVYQEFLAESANSGQPYSLFKVQKK